MTHIDIDHHETDTHEIDGNITQKGDAERSQKGLRGTKGWP